MNNNDFSYCSSIKMINLSKIDNDLYIRHLFFSQQDKGIDIQKQMCMANIKVCTICWCKADHLQVQSQIPKNFELSIHNDNEPTSNS